MKITAGDINKLELQSRSALLKVDVLADEGLHVDDFVKWVVDLGDGDASKPIASAWGGHVGDEEVRK